MKMKCRQFFEDFGVTRMIAVGFFLAIAIAAATPLGRTLWHKLPQRARQIAFPVLMLAGLVLTTAYLVDGTYNPFLYFRF